MPEPSSTPGKKGADQRGSRRGGRGRRRRGRGERNRAGKPKRMPSVAETSAGGLVLDRAEGATHAALIGRVDRRGRMEWVLPKGHVEEGETLEQTAEREVAEETGLTAQVLAPLGPVDYWFVAHGTRIHKTVHHFVLVFRGGDLSTEDSEVTEVAWVPLPELSGRLRYASERRLVADLPTEFGSVAGPP